MSRYDCGCGSGYSQVAIIVIYYAPLYYILHHTILCYAVRVLLVCDTILYYNVSTSHVGLGFLDLKVKQTLKTHTHISAKLTKH